MSRRSAEQAGLQAQLRAEQSTEKLTVMEPEKALADLGGIAEILRKAAPALKARLHASSGVRLEATACSRGSGPPQKPHVSGGGLEPPRP